MLPYSEEVIRLLRRIAGPEHIGWNEQLITPTGADQIVFGPNEKRWGFIFSAPSTSLYTFSFKGATAVSTSINMPVGAQTLVLTYPQVGDAIRGELHLFGTLNNQLTIVELMAL